MSTRRLLLGASCATVFLACLGLSTAKAEELALSSEEAVRLALERNVALRSEAAEVEAAHARLDGASRLFQSNPEVRGAIGQRRREGAATKEYGVDLSQEVELGGQRGARIDAAGAGFAAAEARLVARRLEVVVEVREAFSRAQAAEMLLELAEDAMRVAEQSWRTAEQRLEAGATSRVEVNAARIELGRARRAFRLEGQRRAAAVSELARLLALSAETKINLRGELAAPSPELPLNVEQLVARAHEQRPDLVAARQEAVAAAAERRFAVRAVIPNPKIGAVYERDEGADVILGTLALDLPLFNQNQAERGVSEARLTQAELVLEAVERQVALDVSLAANRLTAANTAAGDFSQGALAAMEENLELMAEAYAAGKVGFVELLLIRRETLEARRDYIDALEELASARARLAQVVGTMELELRPR